ncbi:unnamed protein product [Dicrocoelium dendriticum]|nr:unnamed protein product [Dicrocoelium dendriticum]
MQITSICGNVLSRTLSGGRAERNEALLLHAFTQHGYIVPDPPVYRRGKGTHDEVSEALEQGDELQTSAGRRKPAYTGGLVLEPKKGFYDKYILLLDFNSLYPSIIQEFNVCFTTVDRELVTGGALSVGQSSESEMASERTGSGPSQSKAFDLDSMVASLLSSVHGASAGSSTAAAPDPLLSHLRLPTSQAPGLLPAEIRRLVESRKEVKKLIATTTSASPLQLAQWNTRQAALKLTANSVYGCLGFAASRFFARGLAALVTGLGRAVLMNTRDLVERMNLEVIYGDTDSIMINTNTTDLLAALTIGERVRQEVNKHYRLLELDTDGVYSAMLLLAKKKYAALAINDPVQWASAYRAAQAKNITIAPPTKKQELKGLDIVRRDWSALAVNVGRRCVAALLSGDPKDVILERIHTDLSETADKVKQGQLPMSDFIITRMLTKDPEDYADAKSLPHVQVALRLNHSNSTQSDERNPTGSTRRFRAGDTVEYIICNDGSNSAATQRGYSPSELADQERNKLANTTNTPVLSVDVNYYLAHQIHPVVCRLVSPIEGTSPARIADCLGLDPSGYQRQGTALTGVDEDDEIVASEGAGNGFSSWGDVDPLTVSCPAKCGGPPLEIKPISLGVPTKTWTCSHCSHNVLHSVDSIRVIVNRLTVLARQCIVRYQLGWLRCEDPACDLISRSIHCPPSFMGIHGESDGLWARGCRPLCPGCGGLALLKAQYTEGRLYRQLCFYRHLISTALKLAAESYAPPSLSRLLQQSRSHFDRLLSHSAFAMVDLSQLFSGLRGVSSTAA